MNQVRSESAGEHLVGRVPVAAEADLVGTVLERLTTEPFDALEAVFVVDEDRLLVGGIRFPELQRAARETKIGELVDRAYPRVGPHHDQELVAGEAIRRRASSVAVVDQEGRLLGTVPALALLDILRHEHVEDLHRLAGIRRERARDRSALEAPPARRARDRLPWLLVGLTGSMLAAVVVSRFQHLLERRLAIAFFIPTIVYVADAIGTQTEAIVVRGLSISRLPLRHVLVGEIRTGLLIGATLAALSLPMVALAFDDVRLGLSVAAAILAAGASATTIGLLLPWLLQRMGSDPALGSGPVATVIQDLLSLLIYFAVTVLVMA